MMFFFSFQTIKYDSNEDLGCYSICGILEQEGIKVTFIHPAPIIGGVAMVLVGISLSS